MESSDVSAVYVHVVEDVIDKVREKFIASGAGEGVLDELQALWEAKMVQSGNVDGTIKHICDKLFAGPTIGILDLNVPCEGPVEESELTAEMLFPPTPLPTPLPETLLPGQTPLPGVVDQLVDNVPTVQSYYDPSKISAIRNDMKQKSGRPIHHTQPPSTWMKQRPLGRNANAAYFEAGGEGDRGARQPPVTLDAMMFSRKRKRDGYASQEISRSYLPQQDGSGDIALDAFVRENMENQTQNYIRSVKQEITNSSSVSNEEAKACQLLPQQDGLHDEYDDVPNVSLSV